MSETREVSRRTVLKAGAVAALSVGSEGVVEPATATATDPPAPSAGSARFDEPGTPSRKAARAFAEKEYEHYPRMGEEYAQQSGPNAGNSTGSGTGGRLGKPTSPNFSRTVDAVKEFGVDPKGNRPINEDIASIPEDTLVVFPPGTYLMTGMVQVDATKCGLVGADYKSNSPPKAGKKATTFAVESGTRAGFEFRMKTGLVGNFIFDQTAPKATMGLKAGSSGFVQYRDVVWNGVVDTVGSAAVDKKDYLCAIQADKGATARCTRFKMAYNGIPGTKNIGAKNAFWVGTSNQGTAQIEDCQVVGNASNGVYGGRTPGNVQIKGGRWRNNAVSQNRFSGAKSWSDGVTIEIDADGYKGPTGDYGGFNEKIGTSGIQIERGDNGISKPSGAQVRNADIRIRSTGKSGLRAGIGVLGSGGGAQIENTRIIVQVDRPAVTAESPGGGYAGASAPPPHTITMSDSLLAGTNANPTIRVSGRENSLIRSTCLKISGASQDSIRGMKIGSGVGFGKQCKSGGLKAPKKVGSSGKLSSLPAPSYNGSASTGASASSGEGMGWGGKLLGGLVAAPLVGIAVIALPLILGLVVLGGVTFGGLLVFFKKLG
jgi:hypothetical protein